MFGEWTKEVEAVIEILKPAIELSLVGQEKLKQNQVEQKKDGTVVSICDFACQTIVMNGLQKEFPTDYVLGEEEVGKADDEFLGLVKSLLPEDLDPVKICSRAVMTIEDSYKRCWVIDPIDGTYGFVVNGNYAIATALLVDRHVVCSIVAWPRHDKSITGIDLDGPVIFAAAEGHGAYAIDLNNKRIRLTKPVNPKPISITSKQHVGNAVSLQHYIMEKIGFTENIEMVSMTKGFVVAAGGASIYVRIPWGANEENVWDIAPFELFVREAGGIGTTGMGEPIEYRQNGRVAGTQEGLLFTNRGPEFHQKVLEAYREALDKYRWF